MEEKDFQRIEDMMAGVMGQFRDRNLPDSEGDVIFRLRG